MTFDANLDGAVDEEELKAWIQAQIDAGTAEFIREEWVWNIADLVIQEQEINNDGGKLFKIRWYPVATTSFIP